MTLVLENFKSEVDSLAQFRAHNFDLEELENGNRIIRDFPVFRTGTFKDSMGEQRSWETQHLAQMVSNFQMLREQGRFEDVPVRDGHPGFFGSTAPGTGPGRIVGYVTDLRVGDANVDGETLLVADFEFTEAEAAEKFSSGTFRARSSEIGMYETNDEAVHWPVFLGFAFVDIGAVEKLFGRSFTSNHFTLSEDTEMGTKNGDGESTIDLTNGGEAAEETEETAGTGESEVTEETEATSATEATATHAASGNNSGGAVGGNFMFRVGGEPTTDFSQVQQHIDHLESIQSEIIESAREEFVNGLADAGVIAATQVDSMQELVRGMSTEQYNQFTEMYKDAPPNALFANHGAGGTNEDGSQDVESSEPDEIETLEARVDYARKSGLGEEEVRKLASYKRLMELKGSEGDN